MPLFIFIKIHLENYDHAFIKYVIGLSIAIRFDF